MAEGHQIEPNMAYGSNDAILQSEASYYGKKFLRMAGIVKMLHAFNPPYEHDVKYSYANPRKGPKA